MIHPKLPLIPEDVEDVAVAAFVSDRLEKIANRGPLETKGPTRGRPRKVGSARNILERIPGLTKSQIDDFRKFGNRCGPSFVQAVADALFDGDALALRSTAIAWAQRYPGSVVSHYRRSIGLGPLSDDAVHALKHAKTVLRSLAMLEKAARRESAQILARSESLERLLARRGSQYTDEAISVVRFYFSAHGKDLGSEEAWHDLLIGQMRLLQATEQRAALERQQCQAKEALPQIPPRAARRRSSR